MNMCSRCFTSGALHPVEFLADGQVVEDARRALTNGGFQQRQVAGRDDRADDSALLVVARRIHRDEAGEDLVRRPLRQRDAAQEGVGGEAGVVGIHRQDVLVTRHRPVRPEALAHHVMHRVLLAQPLEVPADDVLLEQVTLADVDLLQRHRPGLVAFGMGNRVVHESARRGVAL
jgi:hypothetical protein